MESKVIESLKSKILTEEILSELLLLTNQAIRDSHQTDNKQISFLQLEINKAQRNLGNLYHALESGKVDIDDLAPRIKELRATIDDFTGQKLALEQKQTQSIEPMTKRQLRAYVADLRAVLEEGSLFERKSFIKSFVKRVSVVDRKVSIEYTYPIWNHNTTQGDNLVLSSKQKSSPGRD